jgi:hypothetical protein
MTGGKPIAGAVGSQSISSVSAINPLVAFYDIHGGNINSSYCIKLQCKQLLKNILICTNQKEEALKNKNKYIFYGFSL